LFVLDLRYQISTAHKIVGSAYLAFIKLFNKYGTG
jgi:hypothetical protein